MEITAEKVGMVGSAPTVISLITLLMILEAVSLDAGCEQLESPI
jgi:hypothetical protein